MRKQKWHTDFTSDDVIRLFRNNHGDILQSIMKVPQYSLAWFIEKVFCNQQGKPLKLEAFQMVMLNMLWHRKFPMIIGCRGMGKTFLLGLYALLRAILNPGSKIVIVGAGFRQAKLVFKYIESLYNQSPIIRHALREYGGPKYHSDSATLQVGLSTIKAIPIGDGEKIRGERATVLICDEFGSIPPEIFEVVLAPFTAVHLNPTERAATMRFIRRLEKIGADKNIIKKILETQDFGNQVIVSGTATYQHNHFYHRYVTCRMFINSKGDPKKLKKALEARALQTTGKSVMVDHADVQRLAETWYQYAVYQVPYYALPEGFLDEDSVRSSKASFSDTRFKMEYEGQFPEDSDGFIRRSWIESATPRIENGEDPVTIELYGDPRYTYVLGLDPARWNDNFAATVLKITDRGLELVYSVSWDRTKHEESARKILEIMRRFPTIEHIAMDKGGGGDAIAEWLCKPMDGHDTSECIWPIREQLEHKADMSAPGRHILELVNFKGWTSSAAYSLEAAITRRKLLFPYKGDDAAVHNQYCLHFKEHDLSQHVLECLAEDLWGVDEWDAKESGKSIKLGIFNEINETINETCAIVKTVTPGGTEQFDLPRLSDQPEGLDMRRRDRFSALMLANYAARVYTGSGRKPSNSPGISPSHTSNRRHNTSTRRRFNLRGRVAY